MAAVKAYLALLVIPIVWGSMILRQLPLLIVAYLYDRKHKPLPKQGRLYNVLLGQDIYVNTILGGFFRTTVSSELGEQQKTRRSGDIAAGVVDWLFILAGDAPGHCANAIEKEDKHLFDPKVAAWSFAAWLIGGTFKVITLITIWNLLL